MSCDCDFDFDFDFDFDMLTGSRGAPARGERQRAARRGSARSPDRSTIQLHPLSASSKSKSKSKSKSMSKSKSKSMSKSNPDA